MYQTLFQVFWHINAHFWSFTAKENAPFSVCFYTYSTRRWEEMRVFKIGNFVHCNAETPDTHMYILTYTVQTDTHTHFSDFASTLNLSGLALPTGNWQYYVTPWNVLGSSSLAALTYTLQQYLFLSCLSLKISAPLSNAGVVLCNIHMIFFFFNRHN